MGIDFRRIIIGTPLATSQASHQRLNKVRALAVFSSDALSSTSYATEAILLVLIAAGTLALGTSMWIALGIAALMVLVALSYYQTIHAYPNGGGAYIVSSENLGKGPGLVAAASLLIDYTLTVAVSVSAGTAALTSAFPALSPYRVDIALVIVAFITGMNLRGVRESGTFFAVPTYAFIIGIFTMIIVGVFRVVTGDFAPVPPPSPEVLAEELKYVNGLTLLLLLRGFAAGCTALTGIEAISNGIPAFKKPESQNAAQTLMIMVALLSTMFIGITYLANQFQIVAVHHAETTVLSQISRAVFGDGSLMFYYLQFATLFILSLAANTAYADFPRLASLIAKDRYLPRQLTGVGDRLVFSNGIVLLAVVSGIIIVLFNAREHNILPLYAVGVFLGFTLSQAGMVVHWLKERQKEGFVPTFHWRYSLVLNGFGALCTGVVLMVLLVTKFTEGAWLVAVTIPILMALFVWIHKHYEIVAESLTLDGITPGPIKITHPDRSHAPVVVLMNSLNRCSLQAIEYAIRISDNVRVCAIEIDPRDTVALKERWEKWHLDLDDCRLDIVPSPYREIGRPLIEYLHQIDQESGEEIPTMVLLPEFVVEHWWERYLHNQTSVAIREALYHDQIANGRGRPVISVPYRIGDELYQPETEALAEDVDGMVPANPSSVTPISPNGHDQPASSEKAAEG